MKYSKLLQYAEKYNFDLVPYEVDEKFKKPTAGAGFTDPKNIVKESPLTKKLLANGHPNCGIVLKNDIGLKLKDRQLVVIDIDDKKKTGKGDEIFNAIVQELGASHGVNIMDITKITEKSKNNGHHIFLTTDAINGTDKILVDTVTGGGRVEIEVFTSSRGLITSPSDGYEVMSGAECIDFDVAYKSFIPYDKLISFLDQFRSLAHDRDGKELGGGAKGFKVVEGFSIDQSKVKRIEKGWKKFQTFLNGSTDSDWDAIDSTDPRVYIANNIMPWMVVTDQVDTFIETIRKYGHKWVSQWVNYPARWLNTPFEDRPFGSDVRGYLVKLGYAQVDSNKKPTAQDHAEEFINQVMPTSYEGSLMIEGVMYKHCGLRNYLVPMTPDELIDDVIAYHDEKTEGGVLAEAVLVQVQKTITRYMGARSKDPKCKWLNRYRIDWDNKYLEEVAIPFNNGTLYVRPCEENGYEVDFQEGHFSSDDKCMLSINCDFTEKLLDFTPNMDSPVDCWFDAKFDDPNVKEFICMFLGSILVPSYNPEVLVSIFSPKGATGKSTMLDTLRIILDHDYDTSKSKVSETELHKFNDRFVGSELATSLVNLSSENDKRLDSERIKKILSRETLMVEQKGIDHYSIKPLAKHLAMANKRPEYVNDGGMTRRIAVFEANAKQVMTHVEANAFNRMFKEDWTSLFKLMLKGLIELVKSDFPNMSAIWSKDPRFEVYKNQQNENTSSVESYLLERGYQEILGGYITKTELYSSFKMWCKEQDILNPPIQKHFFNTLKANDYVDFNSNKRRNGNTRVLDVKEEKKKFVIEYIADLI